MRHGRGVTDPAQLDRDVSIYLTLFQDVYGKDRWMFKHHQLLHFSSLFELPALPSAFCLERKHRSLKRTGDVTVTRANWDVTVLRECTVAHVCALEYPRCFDPSCHIVDPHPLSKKLKLELSNFPPQLLDGMLTGIVARCNQWEKVAAGDFVVVETAEATHWVGRLCLNLTTEGLVVSLLVRYKHVSTGLSRDSVHEALPGGVWAPTSAIAGTCLHSDIGSECVRVIRPLHIDPVWAQ